VSPRTLQTVLVPYIYDHLSIIKMFPTICLTPRLYLISRAITWGGGAAYEAQYILIGSIHLSKKSDIPSLFTGVTDAGEVAYAPV
jgi:hypothetical protein